MSPIFMSSTNTHCTHTYFNKQCTKSEIESFFIVEMKRAKTKRNRRHHNFKARIDFAHYPLKMETNYIYVTFIIISISVLSSLRINISQMDFVEFTIGIEFCCFYSRGWTTGKKRFILQSSIKYEHKNPKIMRHTRHRLSIHTFLYRLFVCFCFFCFRSVPLSPIYQMKWPLKSNVFSEKKESEEKRQKITLIWTQFNECTP